MDPRNRALDAIGEVQELARDYVRMWDYARQLETALQEKNGQLEGQRVELVELREQLEHVKNNPCPPPVGWGGVDGT